MKGCLRGLTINYTTFYENYNSVTTYDCFGHNIKAPDSVYLFDHYLGSFEKALNAHIEDRKTVSETIRTEPFNEEGCFNYIQHQIDESFNIMLEENIIRKTQNGYKFSISLPYLKYIHNSIKGYKRAAKALRLNNQESSKSIINQPEQKLFNSSDKITLIQQLDEKPTTSSRKKKVNTFLLSAVAFVLLFGVLGIPWSTLPLLIIVLLIHELGHFFAMRYFGYQDTSIFFIPLFGAAAKGEKEHVTRVSKKYYFSSFLVPIFWLLKYRTEIGVW